jgi:hypothetical protein
MCLLRMNREAHINLTERDREVRWRCYPKMPSTIVPILTDGIRGNISFHPAATDAPEPGWQRAFRSPHQPRRDERRVLSLVVMRDWNDLGDR